MIVNNKCVISVFSAFWLYSGLNFVDVIRTNFNLSSDFSAEQVAEEYLKIKEEEKVQEEKEQTTLKELPKRLSILESENKALREELTQIQTSIASLTSLITTTLEEK